MKFLMLCVALAAVIAYANSDPVSDNFKMAYIYPLRFIMDYQRELPITPSLKNLLETVRRHFPSMLEMLDAPKETEKMKLFMEDMVKIDKQDCAAVTQYHKNMPEYFKIPDRGDLTDDELRVLEAAEAKEDPVVLDAKDIIHACMMFESNFYKEMLKFLGLEDPYTKQSLCSECEKEMQRKSRLRKCREFCRDIACSAFACLSRGSRKSPSGVNSGAP